MLNAFLGIKITQSQSFTSLGKIIPVTLVQAGPCFITGIKTLQNDGYNAIQLGIGQKRVINITKPMLGHLKKAGLDKNPPRFFREIRLSLPAQEDDLGNLGDLKMGTEIKIGDIFTAGDTIQVTSISKGKGFQGVVKRHHFKGGPRTHGQSDRERAPGAIGSTTTPGRVYKGKRMAGRMGNDRVTIKNLKVVKIDTQKNILTISGLVAGGRNALLVIRKINS